MAIMTNCSKCGRMMNVAEPCKSCGFKSMLHKSVAHPQYGKGTVLNENEDMLFVEFDGVEDLIEMPRKMLEQDTRSCETCRKGPKNVCPVGRYLDKTINRCPYWAVVKRKNKEDS